MEIQNKRKAFEQWFKTTGFYENAQDSAIYNEARFDVFDINNGFYRNRYVQLSWEAWQAAKAQAVPEGFVVVAKELPEKIAEKMAIDRIDKPIHANDPVWSEIAEESYKNQVKLKKWEFWRDYKAMIEAQEPTND